MKIKVLMEDTAGLRYGENGCDVQSEHGLSLYLETTHHRLLMDTGASDRTWENAEAMGVDITAVDTVVISHGHYDHTGGLPGFAVRNTAAEIYMQSSACGEFYHGERYIGIDRRIPELPRMHLIDSDGEYKIDNELSVFSGINGRRLWPQGNLELSEMSCGKPAPDTFAHEQCLTVSTGGRKILLSGCAHNGIVNILSRFRELYQCCPDAVISGFHMIKEGDFTEAETAGIAETARELAELPTVFYTGHCTGADAYGLMKEIMQEKLSLIHSGDDITLPF